VNYLLPAFFFIFGSIIGSFLNVVILRYNTGRSAVSGRSGCFSCGRELRWYENIPIISFIVLRGKCSSCSSKISWQYPLVEFSTAVLFLSIFFKYGHLLNVSPVSFIGEYGFSSFIFCLLIIIFVYDLRHKIIPDFPVYLFIALTFINTAFSNPSLLDLAAGPIMALPFAALWLVSRGRWIGLGDAKLALGIGWFLGFFLGVSAIVLSFWIGALMSLALLLGTWRLRLAGGGFTMKSEIPFAPFLIVGPVIIFFFPIDIIGLGALFGLNI